MICGHDGCHLFGAFSCVFCEIDVCWWHVDRHEECGIEEPCVREAPKG